MPTPFNINGWEIVVIATLFLLLFGPEKLPEIAMQAGRLFRELRQAAETATGELTRELQRAAEENEETAADVREIGESARRLLQNKSKTVTDVVKDQLREVTDEIGSIAPVIAAPAGEAETPSSDESSDTENSAGASTEASEAASDEQEDQGR